MQEDLARMRRQYTTAQAAAALALARERMPDACIGTDVITGFPEESDEEFERGLEWIEKLELSYLHVFPYSKRTSTSAAKRWRELPRATVHERARRMQALDRRLRRRFEDRFIGTQTSVLFEGARDAQSGFLKGTSDNYLRVLGDVDDRFTNRIVRATITGRRGARLEARPA